MSDVSKDQDKRPSPPKNSAVVLLLKDIGSTTWRMFVPTVGGTVLGYWMDESLSTSPWFFVLGVLIGSSIAALLIKRQLQRL